MDANQQPKYPGVFVKHKGPIRRCKSLTLDEMSFVTHQWSGSPTGLTPTSTPAMVRPNMMMGFYNDGTEMVVGDGAKRADSPQSELGSEFSLARGSSECGTDPGEVRPKRVKRKKKDRARKEVDNAAVDAVRYKTRMCKNWEEYGKCPYGPRCLFAHGPKEVRSCSSNHTAISSAATSGSPERQFYSVSHFPSFMPLPFPQQSMYGQPPNAMPQ